MYAYSIICDQWFVKCDYVYRSPVYVNALLKQLYPMQLDVTFVALETIYEVRLLYYEKITSFTIHTG